MMISKRNTNLQSLFMKHMLVFMERDHE